ncbi:MAG TPA: FHA domain-containing protein [Blastocatellia bacterium]
MTPEVWEQIKRIFDEAIEYQGQERLAFIDAACRGDETLRGEVESLIACHDEAGNFIELAVCQAAAELIAGGEDAEAVPKGPESQYTVGWLVCVAGPNTGQDYRVRHGANRIGRSSGMDIHIRSDATVSRNAHAVISYNHRGNEFSLAPGKSNRCVYLNDDEVPEPRRIKPFDRIQVGETELIFVPLCNERFIWGVRE